MSCRSCALFVSLSCLLGQIAHVRAEGPKDAPQLVSATEAISPDEQRKMFHLPPGFTIQLVAAEPDIRKPMNLNFDVHGRLYVTQSEEYPYPAKEGAPSATW